MNRPLAAFGALMTFLVLAMLAVSSTSRSTSVQAARPGKKLALIPAREEFREISNFKFQISDLEEEEDCLESRCGRVVAETYLTSLKVKGNPQTELTAVRIVPAADANGAWLTTVLDDCLSFFNVECDWIVSQETKNQEPNSQEPTKLYAKELDDGEMAAVFFDLVDARRGKSAGSTTGGRAVAHKMMGTAHPTYDYAEWIDQARSWLVLTVDVAKTSESARGVRSSGWLRHSAAASLYRVGALLQAAALEVEQASEDSSDRAAGDGLED